MRTKKAGESDSRKHPLKVIFGGSWESDEPVEAGLPLRQRPTERAGAG